MISLKTDKTIFKDHAFIWKHAEAEKTPPEVAKAEAAAETTESNCRSASWAEGCFIFRLITWDLLWENILMPSSFEKRVGGWERKEG